VGLTFFYWKVADSYWFTQPQLWWEGWPVDQPSVSDAKIVYNVVIAHYMHQTLWQFVETKQSDFWVQITHHFTALGLLFFSFLLNFVRAGLFVLLLVETNNLFVRPGKLLVYMGEVRPWAKKVADVVFLAFILWDLVTHFWIYPVAVLWRRGEGASAWYWPLSPDGTLSKAEDPFAVALGFTNASGGFMNMPLACPGYVILTVMLWALMIMFTFWMYLILKIAVKMAAEGKLEDIRSDDEQEGNDVNGAMSVYSKKEKPE